MILYSHKHLERIHNRNVSLERQNEGAVEGSHLKGGDEVY